MAALAAEKEKAKERDTEFLALKERSELQQNELAEQLTRQQQELKDAEAMVAANVAALETSKKQAEERMEENEALEKEMKEQKMMMKQVEILYNAKLADLNRQKEKSEQLQAKYEKLEKEKKEMEKLAQGYEDRWDNLQDEMKASGLDR